MSDKKEKPKENIVRVAGIHNDSITDGRGLRYVLFLQGCNRKCEGCHNPQTWDECGGDEYSVSEIYAQIKANTLLDGVTFSGGEPFLQSKELCALAEKIKKLNLNLAIFTGFIYEELAVSQDENILKLLSLADILIDGAYVEALRDPHLRFRGPSNQRIIDLNKTREAGAVVLADW